jgi:hypothetical protein
VSPFEWRRSSKIAKWTNFECGCLLSIQGTPSFRCSCCCSLFGRIVLPGFCARVRVGFFPPVTCLVLFVLVDAKAVYSTEAGVL